MQGIAKAILVTIITSIIIVLLMNMSFFFPWYLTLVTETYYISQEVASENYLKRSSYKDIKDALEDRPIFNKRKNDIKVLVAKDAGFYNSAIPDIDRDDYSDLSDYEKPYQQRGKPVYVKVEAVYPLTVTLWGKEYSKDIPMSFQIVTTGLKHYKDLEYYTE